MSEKKVEFHALERLDLIDVDAIQAQVYEYARFLLGNALGKHDGGLLRKPTSFSIDTTNDVFNFGDFVFITSVDDSTVNQANTSEVVVVDSSESIHGTCSVDTIRTLVQSYYNSNSALPPAPNESNFLPQYDIYYPYVWVRAVDANILTDARRFWSISNAREDSQNVVTRKKRAVEFSVSATKPSSEYTAIARIYGYTVANNIVFIDPADVEYILFADDYFTPSANQVLSQYSTLDTTKGGLSDVISVLQKQIDDIRTNGLNDSLYTGSQGVSRETLFPNQPNLSLDGLADRTYQLSTSIGNLETRLNTQDLQCIVYIKSKINKFSGTAGDWVTTIDFDNYTPYGTNATGAGWFNVDNVYQDYTFAVDAGAGTTGYNSKTLTGSLACSIMSNLIIEIPSVYDGYYLSVEIDNPAVSAIDNRDQYIIDNRYAHAHSAFLVRTSPQVDPVTVTDQSLYYRATTGADTLTSTTKKGFRVGIAGLASYNNEATSLNTDDDGIFNFDSSGNLNNENFKIDLKLHIKLFASRN